MKPFSDNLSLQPNMLQNSHTFKFLSIKQDDRLFSHEVYEYIFIPNSLYIQLEILLTWFRIVK